MVVLGLSPPSHPHWQFENAPITPNPPHHIAPMPNLLIQWKLSTDFLYPCLRLLILIAPRQQMPFNLANLPMDTSHDQQLASVHGELARTSYLLSPVYAFCSNHSLRIMSLWVAQVSSPHEKSSWELYAQCEWLIISIGSFMDMLFCKWLWLLFAVLVSKCTSSNPIGSLTLALGLLEALWIWVTALGSWLPRLTQKRTAAEGKEWWLFYRLASVLTTQTAVGTGNNHWVLRGCRMVVHSSLWSSPQMLPKQSKSTGWERIVLFGFPWPSSLSALTD